MSEGQTLTRTVAAKPFMFQYAEPRRASAEIPGAYDDEHSVWCVTRDDQRIPVVEAAASVVLEIQTKTKVLQEADDDAPSLDQLRTKTFADEEVDDDQHLHAAMLEITTKTDLQVESDDHSTF